LLIPQPVIAAFLEFMAILLPSPRRLLSDCNAPASQIPGELDVTAIAKPGDLAAMCLQLEQVFYEGVVDSF